MLRRIFGRPWSLFAMRRSLFGLYMPTVLPMSCSSSGTNEPYVSIHCWGLYIWLLMWYRTIGRGVKLLLVGWGDSQGCPLCFCEFDFVIYGCALGGVGFSHVRCIIVTLLVICWFLGGGRSFGCGCLL